MTDSDAQTWRRCSACKQPIGFGAVHQVCSVSTCNQKRTGMVFCSVDCWEIHLPVANHREAWAVEATAPASGAPGVAKAPPRRHIASHRPTATPATKAEAKADDEPVEVLIVASRLKDYVKTRSGFATSDRVLEPLSRIVREVCDRAIRNAQRDGRKTVLDRDIPGS